MRTEKAVPFRGMGPSSSGPGGWGKVMGKETDRVMIYFMCRFDWATVCPDIRLNIILGGSMRAFLDEISI